MHGKHLTLAERELVAIRLASGESQAKVAEELGCHVSTIRRELNRNAVEGTYLPATAYASVPFKTVFLLEYHLSHKATICLLDDWEHGWPILGEIGDRHEEWQELTGKGIARLKVDIWVSKSVTGASSPSTAHSSYRSPLGRG